MGVLDALGDFDGFGGGGVGVDDGDDGKLDVDGAGFADVSGFVSSAIEGVTAKNTAENMRARKPRRLGVGAWYGGDSEGSEQCGTYGAGLYRRVNTRGRGWELGKVGAVQNPERKEDCILR